MKSHPLSLPEIPQPSSFPPPAELPAAPVMPVRLRAAFSLLFSSCTEAWEARKFESFRDASQFIPQERQCV
jgi:hypothetical protein